jgi:chemotaxis protein MotB
MHELSDDDQKSDGWLTTFGDLMALLFALFVLINSFSEIDAESFKRNAGPIAQAFNKETPKFVNLDNLAKAESELTANSDDPNDVKESEDPNSQSVFSFGRAELVSQELKLLFYLKRSLRRESISGQIALQLEDDNILVRLPSDYSFSPGSAQLSPQMQPALNAIARAVAFDSGPIVISGHTDSDPISTDKFGSNWELSSARAISVLHYLVGTGLVDPNRLTAIGHAETKPLIDENLPQDKALNRRVEIRIALRRQN